jgi:hypothetical protein
MIGSEGANREAAEAGLDFEVTLARRRLYTVQGEKKLIGWTATRLECGCFQLDGWIVLSGLVRSWASVW